MTFYKIKAKIYTPLSEIDTEKLTSSALELCNSSVEENALSGTVYFLSSMVGYTATGVAIVRDDRLHGGITFPWEKLPFKAESEAAEEITTIQFDRLLNKASYSGYVSDQNDIYETFMFADRFFNLKNFICGESATEMLAPAIDKEQSIIQANNILWGKAAEEIERIYADVHHSFLGHPTHYILKSDIAEHKTDIIQNLISALYEANRLQSKRYTEVTMAYYVNAYGSSSIADLRLLYEHSIGATVVIQLDVGKCLRASSYSDLAVLLQNLSDLIYHYRHKVLTVFSLPYVCEQEKEMLLGCLDWLPFIELTADVVSAAEAEKYILRRMKQDGIKIDKDTLAIDMKYTYNGNNLEKLYQKRYLRALQEKVYPQYKNIVK